MIIKDHQLEKIVQGSKGFLGFLVYGPNEGLVKEQIDRIINDLLPQDEFEKIILQGKALETETQMLDEIVKTVSMFHSGKIVVVESLKEKSVNIIEEIIEDAPQKVILILRNENLNKTSKIRKLFEISKSCFSLACYEDDGRSIMKNIEEFINRNRLPLSRDIKNYLIHSLSSDRMITKNELEKVEIYSKGSERKIELEDIKDLLNDSSSISLNKMNESMMYGNTSKSSKIANKLLTEGTSPISLLRSAMNYLLRVQKTKVEMKKGNNFDEAIKSLRPPVFWKDKDSFQKHCIKWPVKNIEKHIFKLLEAEILCKLDSKLAILNCEKSIMLIANDGKEYFKD